MASQMQGHKWFAAFWERMVKMEAPIVKRLRQEVLHGLSGRVLEIGAGNGANFPRYPEAVTDLVATEPDPYMLERARMHASELGRTIEIHQATAESLPFPDASFDAVVSTLVLCSVTDQRKALDEILRVLKPGGQFRFFEHVRYKGGLAAASQDFITPIWRWMGGGCNPNRPTGEAIQEAGFAIQEMRRFNQAPPIPPLCVVRPAIIGTAVKSGA